MWPVRHKLITWFTHAHFYSPAWSQLTSAMCLTQVGESPHIANPNAEAHTGQDVLGFIVPLGPVTALLLLHPVQIFIVGDPEIQPWVGNKQLHGEPAEAAMSILSLLRVKVRAWGMHSAMVRHVFALLQYLVRTRLAPAHSIPLFLYPQSWWQLLLQEYFNRGSCEGDCWIKGPSACRLLTLEPRQVIRVTPGEWRDDYRDTWKNVSLLLLTGFSSLFRQKKMECDFLQSSLAISYSHSEFSPIWWNIALAYLLTSCWGWPTFSSGEIHSL